MRRITRFFSRFFGQFIMLAACTLLFACGDSPDEISLQKNLVAMRDAIQTHETDKFMGYVAPEYKNRFHPDRQALSSFINRHLSANPVIYIYMADIDITFNEENKEIADILLYAGTAGGPDELPVRGQFFKVKTNWKKVDGSWLLVTANWRPALFAPGGNQPLAR